MRAGVNFKIALTSDDGLAAIFSGGPGNELCSRVLFVLKAESARNVDKQLRPLFRIIDHMIVDRVSFVPRPQSPRVTGGGVWEED